MERAIDCYKCTKVLPATIDRNKLIKCNTCSKNIHIKCNKTTKKKIDYVLNNLDEFDCRSCLTCNLCQKLVAGNHRGNLCDLCNKWVHAKCNKLEQRDFQKFQEDDSLHFFCSLCLRDTLPTLDLNDNEFHLTMKGVNYSENIDINNITLTEKQLELTKKINEAVSRGLAYDNEDDNNGTDFVNCKYYTVESKY